MIFDRAIFPYATAAVVPTQGIDGWAEQRFAPCGGNNGMGGGDTAARTGNKQRG